MEKVLNGLTRWFVVLALMLAYWPFGHHAHASVQKPTAWRAPAVVGLERAIYTARFDWKGLSYRFVVGTRAHTDSERLQSRFVAELSQEGKITAICERSITGESPLDTNSMLLRCEGAMFSPAAATIKFVFGPTMVEPSLMVWTSPRAVGEKLALVTEASKVEVAKSE